MSKLNKVFKSLILSICLILSITVVCGCGKEDNEQYYNINLTANDYTMGKTYGNNSYKEGDRVIIVAEPFEGYKFVSWSDGNTNVVRELLVSSDVNLVATFAPIPVEPVKYALDKVELYLESVGTISAKNFELFDFYIYSDSEECITRCDLFSDTTVILNNGAEMIRYTVSGGSTITINESNPITFYSSRNSANQFSLNEETVVTVGYVTACHSQYIDSNGVLQSENSGEANHINTRDFSLSINLSQGETVKEISVYNDQAHGIKLVAKLHFVEI